MTDNALKLCYIENQTAYFTSLPLDQQWGDDWNDAPYEHNAGIPYTWRPQSGDPAYIVVTLRFDCPLNEPCERYFNSPYSVEQINRRKVAWLAPSPYGDSRFDHVEIWAGDNPAEFAQKVRLCGGDVYLPSLALAEVVPNGMPEWMKAVLPS